MRSPKVRAAVAICATCRVEAKFHPNSVGARRPSRSTSGGLRCFPSSIDCAMHVVLQNLLDRLGAPVTIGLEVLGMRLGIQTPSVAWHNRPRRVDERPRPGQYWRAVVRP
jgi:hypothetical protein